MYDKIICIGDSITKGKVWREGERRPYISEMSYPEILKKLLGMNVYNEGICDITSEKVANMLDTDLSIEKGDIVIVEIGGNDCTPNWRQVKKNPIDPHYGAVSIDNFEKNLEKIVTRVKYLGGYPVLSTLPPLVAERYYNLLERVFGDGIKKWIDLNGGIYKWHERYSEAVKKVAKETDTYLVDVRNYFLELGDYKEYMSFDGLHPNEKGYNVIAEAFYKDLKPIYAGI
jgi:lysophospholipase L1-like esterase